MTAGRSSIMHGTERAQARVTAAYTAARLGVYDVLPVGAVDLQPLTCTQRGLLSELEAAERHLRLLRCVDGPVAQRLDQGRSRTTSTGQVAAA